MFSLLCQTTTIVHFLHCTTRHSATLQEWLNWMQPRVTISNKHSCDHHEEGIAFVELFFAKWRKRAFVTGNKVLVFVFC